ncbi:MAG: DUF4230 domain-containing protein [Candidatus Paceibacterota bacterium]|jgi:hypothetical protein
MKNRILVFSLVFLLGMFAGFILGIKIDQGQDEKKQIITAETIFDKVASKGVLVTQSAYLNQDVDIEIDNGSDWSNFWWGHKITAESLVRVDLGVDLAQIKKEDISINPVAKTICIKLADPIINSIAIEGDVEMRVSSGILKIIFASDNNEDYNLATARIKEEAQKAIKENTKLFSETKIKAYEILSFLFADIGYQVSCSN